MTEMQKIVEIDGDKYMITHPSPTKAWKMAMKLTKMLGEPFASMAAADGDESAAAQALPLAIGALLRNMDEDETLILIKDILACVEYRSEDGKQMLSDKHFESHFQGRMGHMLKLVTQSIEFQFEDFFVAIGDAIAAIAGKALSKKAA